MRNLTLILMMLVVAAGVSAQGFGSDLTYCGDLSEADCDIITNATYADSATVAGSGALIVTVDGMVFTSELDLDGSYMLDSETVAELMDFYDNAADPMAMMQELYADLDIAFNLLIDTLNAADAQLTLSVSLPQEVTGGMVPDPLEIDLWYNEGAAYADLTALGFADPALAEAGVWGVDLVGLYEMLFEQLESSPELEDAIEEFSDAFAEGDFADMAAMDPYAFADEYTTITRLDDVTVNGQTLAVYETTIDYGALFGSDLMREMMTAQIEAQQSMMQGMLGEDMPEEQLDEMMELQAVMMDEIMNLYATIFEGAVATTTIGIGLDDGFVHTSDSTFTMSVNAVEIAQDFSEVMSETAGEEMPPITAEEIGFETVSLEFGYSVELGSFNDVTAAQIAPPANAQLFPLESLFMQSELEMQ